MNTREKLSWTLLGVASFLGIAAVSTNTTFFTNASLSGWLSLSGETNRLTVAGDALLLDGAAIGGETVWTNSAGIVKPAGGQAATNRLEFVSGAADNDTNIAAIVGAQQSWTGDATLLQINNNAVPVSGFSPWGGLWRGSKSWIISDFGGMTSQELALSYLSEDLNGSSESMLAIHSMKDTNHTALSHVEIYSNADFADSAQASLELYGEHSRQDYVVLKATGGTNDLTQFYIYSDGKYLVNFTPLAADGTTPYRLDAQATHSSGSLFEIGNNVTNKLSVGFDGATTIAQSASEPAAPAAGYFTLFATNNAGKMVLKVRFPTGASQTIATEP